MLGDIFSLLSHSTHAKVVVCSLTANPVKKKKHFALTLHFMVYVRAHTLTHTQSYEKILLYTVYSNFFYLILIFKNVIC